MEISQYVTEHLWSGGSIAAAAASAKFSSFSRQDCLVCMELELEASAWTVAVDTEFTILLALEHGVFSCNTLYLVHDKAAPLI